MQTPLFPSPPPPGALDFFSEHFDPLRALYTKGLQPPIPRVKALDNVVKCRLILPPELPDSWSAWNAAHPKNEPTEVCSVCLYYPVQSSYLAQSEAALIIHPVCHV